MARPVLKRSEGVAGRGLAGQAMKTYGVGAGLSRWRGLIGITSMNGPSRGLNGPEASRAPLL